MPEEEEEYEEAFSISSSVGINLAPDVDASEPIHTESEIIIKKQQIIQHQQQQLIHRQHQQSIQLQREQIQEQEQNELLKKKKYAKEAWPGRKPTNPQESLSISVTDASPAPLSKISPGTILPTPGVTSPQKTKSPPSTAPPKRLLI